MSEEKELKLACLHQAGGDLDHAQRLFDWVSGSVRATPDSEAAEVSAPKQDKPQQSFNYRHPSKYGTDVPRRCYLEELTPEERAIRDLVDTVERLGAHPLLTATVIQLMKAGEDLADWVDIGLRDKAIAALSPGNDLGLLDDGQRSADLSNSLPSAPAATDDDWEDSCGDINCDECHGPRPSASDYSRGAQDAIDSIPRMEGDSAEYYRGYDATIESVGPVGADVPEDERDETWAPPPGYTYIPTQGERCVCVNLMQDGIGNFFCCNRRGETSADAKRIEDESQGTQATEQTGIFQSQTEAAIVDKDEPDPAPYAPINAEEPAGDAAVFARGMMEEAKAEPEMPSVMERIAGMFGKREMA